MPGVSGGKSNQDGPQHGHEAASGHAHAVKPATAKQTVAQHRLELLLWQAGKPTAEAVAELLAEFPADRNAIIVRLHETVGNGFVQQVLRSERWSEAMANGDGRSNHGRTSLPAAQQRRHADQAQHCDGPKYSEVEISAPQGEARAAAQHETANIAANLAVHDANIVVLARSIERVALAGAGDWQRNVVDRFEQLSPAMRVEVQQHVDMTAVLHRMNDWHAVRLGVITPMSNAAAQQHLNRKRAAYIARTIKEFGPANADVLIAYMWQGVLGYDAAEIFSHLARVRMLTKFRALPMMSQVLTAQGTDDITMAEPEEHPWALVKSMVPNPLTMLQKHREKQWGNADLKAQNRDLPPAFQDALMEVTNAQVEASLAPRVVARALFDDMTFGLPGGVADVATGTASAGYHAIQGEYSVAGEELQGVMMILLSVIGVKAYRRIAGAVGGSGGHTPGNGASERTLGAGPTNQLPGAPAKQLPAATEVASTARASATSGVATDAAATTGAAAEAATVVEITEQAALISKRLHARFDGAQLQSVADLLQNDPAANVFARQHGEAGIAALAETKGNVAQAKELVSTRATTRGGEAVKAVDPDGVRSSSTVQRVELAEEMAALEKFGPDISKDADWIAKTDHAVEAAHKFDWDHVLRGEIKRGDAKGYHDESSADGSARIKPGAEISYHDNGVYEAKVQIWNQNSKQWRDKRYESSFFPADWSVARIKYEVIEAFKSRSLVGAEKWQGKSPSGIDIEGFASDHRITFYPLTREP